MGLYIGGNFQMGLAKAADTANRTVTFPDATGTVLVAGASNASLLMPTPTDSGEVAGGAAEALVQAVTITNPPFAGRIFVWADCSVRNGTANDTWRFRIRSDSSAAGVTGTEQDNKSVTIGGSATHGSHCTLLAAYDIAASGTQVIKTTVIRNGGAGVCTAQTRIGYIILPGAAS